MQLSIITLSKNSSKTILTTLSSLKSQKYSNIQNIFIDANSEDGTVDFIKCADFVSYVLISEADNGLYDALNKGISFCEGDVVGILHSDDAFFDYTTLEVVANYFQMDEGLDVLCGSAVFYERLECLSPIRVYKSFGFKPWMLRFGFMPAHTATFIKRSSLKKVGLYDSTFSSAGDFDFFIRIFRDGGLKIKLVEDRFVKMSMGGKSSSGLKSYLRTTVEILAALRKNGIYSNLFFVLLRLPIKFFLKYFKKPV